MVRRRIHRSSSWSPSTQAKSSLFAPRPFVFQAPQDSQGPQTRGDAENDAFNQNKFEAFGSRLKQENDTITSAEQERLGVLQAKMDDFWAQRMQQAKIQPNPLDTLLRNGQALAAQGAGLHARPEHPVVQRVKATLLEGMPKPVRDAIEFLNMVESQPEFSDFLMPVIIQQVKVLEESEFASHCAGLIETINSKIPKEVLDDKGPTPLKDRNIHSIWVHGDYTKDEEALEGFKTRKGSKAEGWQNLIWVYHSLQESNSGLFQEVDGMICRPTVIGELNLLEADFVETIQRWKERPAWVDKFLPLLEILLTKKSYVTMSDIMRMIILYYKGGLYQDVKIQLSTPDAKFFDEPLVNTKKLQLVDAGPNKENWALVAEAGCEMIDKIMEDTLEKFPPAEVLEQLPENYSNSGQYSKAHKELHENLGPWRQIEKQGDKTDTIGTVNPSLKLKNPRPVNSWAHDDSVAFDWEEAFKKAGK